MLLDLPKFFSVKMISDVLSNPEVNFYGALYMNKNGFIVCFCQETMNCSQVVFYSTSFLSSIEKDAPKYLAAPTVM